MAVIDRASGTPKTYYIATGFVDEPLLMTDAAQATVWAAALDPYGTAQLLGTPSAALDLRLPGQWLQAETGGLHQNGWRDYDPSLGRYIQPDPLGIGRVVKPISLARKATTPIERLRRLCRSAILGRGGRSFSRQKRAPLRRVRVQ